MKHFSKKLQKMHRFFFVFRNGKNVSRNMEKLFCRKMSCFRGLVTEKRVIKMWPTENWPIIWRGCGRHENLGNPEFITVDMMMSTPLMQDKWEFLKALQCWKLSYLSPTFGLFFCSIVFDYQISGPQSLVIILMHPSNLGYQIPNPTNFFLLSL